MMYVVFARRENTAQPWSEWSKSSNSVKAESLKQYAIDSGYLAKIVTDKREITDLRSKSHRFFYPEEETPKKRWYFRQTLITRGDG